jgi:hypothetical protein
MSTLPTLSDKETAKVIRSLLRATFPTTTFSVRCGRGAGVSSVRISWTDGPTAARVDSLVGAFEAGSFNGMTDSYDYDRDSFLNIDGVMYRPGTRFIFTERTLSVSLVNRCIAQVTEFWGGVDVVPVAVESSWGWALADDMSRKPVRADLDLDWSTAIYRAAANRETYTRQTSEAL